MSEENLYELHQQLKTAHSQQQDLLVTLRNSQKLLDLEKERNAQLEPDVQSYEQRKKHLSNVDIMRKKKLWLVSVYDLGMAEYSGILFTCESLCRRSR